MTRKGYAVTITVYMNYYLFYGVVKPDAGNYLPEELNTNDCKLIIKPLFIVSGEYDYDHIVSVSSIISLYDDDEFHPDDIIVISDHGLWAPRTTGPVYLFNYTFKDFIGTREDANAKNGDVYTLPASSKLTCYNYGVAHTSVVDQNADLLPVRLETSVNYESPEIDNKV